MKQFLTTPYALAFTAICCLLASCVDKTIEPEIQPVVEITLLDTSNPDYVKVQFKANSTTSRYIYAIGTAEDKESFLDETIPGKVIVASNETKEIKFEGLDPNTKYIVYAMGFNIANDKGPLAMATAGTYTDALMPKLSYVSDVSAGFKIACSFDIYKCKFFLGTPEDKEAFINDDENLDIQFSSEVFDWSENYFTDLKPNTDYVFYIIGYFRNNTETRLFEIPFKTVASDDANTPNVTLEIGEKDFYTQHYIVTPNENCGKIVFYHKRARDFDDMIYGKWNYSGHIMDMLYEFQGRTPNEVSEQSTVYVAVGEKLDVTTKIKEFNLDEPLDIYIQVYNKLLEPVSVKRYSTRTHKMDANLAKPKASDFEVTITSVDAEMQTINFNVKYKGKDCNAFMYDICDAKWIEEKALVEGADPYFIHNELLLNKYGTTSFVYKKNDYSSIRTDKDLAPNKSFYLAICPMNANGPSNGGWGEVVLKEFALP